MPGRNDSCFLCARLSVYCRIPFFNHQFQFTTALVHCGRGLFLAKHGAGVLKGARSLLGFWWFREGLLAGNAAEKHYSLTSGPRGEQEQLDRDVVAACLLQHRGSAASTAAVHSLANQLKVAYSTSLRHLRATAEVARRCQTSHMVAVLDWVWRQKEAGVAKPICYIFRHAFDETKLRLKIQLPELAHSGSAHSKVFVVDCSWCMVLETKTLMGDWEYLAISQKFSPTLRLADSTRGESVAAVLQSGPDICSDRVQSLFPVVYKICESDQAKGNVNAEQLWANAHPALSASLQLFCIGHRVHSVADKVWSLDKELVKQITRVLLALQSSEDVAQLSRAMGAIIASELTVVKADALSPDAIGYRKHVLSLLLPSSQPQGKFARRRATMLALSATLNGDWRAAKPEHRCAGQTCCKNRAHSVLKAQVAVQLFLKSTRPSRLCRGNWLDWARPLSFFLLAYMHKLLGRAFHLAFGQAGPSQEQWGNGMLGKLLNYFF